MAKMKLPEHQVAKFREKINKAIIVLTEKLGLPSDKLPTLSPEHLRVVAAVLGDVGTGREVETWVRLEKSKWEENPDKKKFMNDLLEVVMKEIELLEYFPSDPDQMEDFMQNVEKIRSSSVFKR